MYDMFLNKQTLTETLRVYSISQAFIYSADGFNLNDLRIIQVYDQTKR